ncbi:hypothetical protein [Leptospira borgpetersenii]
MLYGERNHLYGLNLGLVNLDKMAPLLGLKSVG